MAVSGEDLLKPLRFAIVVFPTVDRVVDLGSVSAFHLGILRFVAKPVKKRVLKRAPKEPFPLWPFLLLLATIGLFWILPRQMGNPPVKTEFAQGER